MTPGRRRSGCLSLLALLLLGIPALFAVLMAITNPWIYTVGGHFRLLPIWEGTGELQGPGGSYRLYVSFSPGRRASRILPSTSISGSGWICAPSGHSYPVRMSGGAPSIIWKDMNGQPFTLYTWQRRSGSTNHLPPKVELTGRWVGAELVMQDKGSLAGAFMPDGSLPPSPGPPGPQQSITLSETFWWFDPC